MVRKVALSLMGHNGRAFSAGQSLKGTGVQIIAPAMQWIRIVLSTMLKHEHETSTPCNLYFSVAFFYLVCMPNEVKIIPFR